MASVRRQLWRAAGCVLAATAAGPALAQEMPAGPEVMARPASRTAPVRPAVRAWPDALADVEATPAPRHALPPPPDPAPPVVAPEPPCGPMWQRGKRRGMGWH